MLQQHVTKFSRVSTILADAVTSLVLVYLHWSLEGARASTEEGCRHGFNESV